VTKMKRTIFAVGLATSLLLAGCASNEDSDGAAEPETKAANEVQDIKKLVNDYSVGNIEEQTAAINSHQLIVTKSDKSQVTYDLPEDEFFVSIAPYIDQTHP
jgi:PBP1b-binding outer membrane lipoprotein LpoB